MNKMNHIRSHIFNIELSMLFDLEFLYEARMDIEYIHMYVLCCINQNLHQWMWLSLLMRNLAKKIEFGVTLSWRNFETVFSKSENTEFILQKKWYRAEILHGGRHLNCRWKIDKSNNKKYEGKKPMLRIEPRPLRAERQNSKLPSFS
jgi:hypothetical protein